MQGIFYKQVLLLDEEGSRIDGLKDYAEPSVEYGLYLMSDVSQSDVFYHFLPNHITNSSKPSILSASCDT